MKLNLNKTPEDIEKEKAAKQREIEADIQQRNHERQEKIQALRKVQTRNKIIIITVVVILFIAMMTFGIYNIFVKKSLSAEEVQNIAYNQINHFPQNGVEGYLSRNIETMFDKYSRFDKENYASMKIDTNSLYVSKINALTNDLAVVDFSVDISITEKDKLVTDEKQIELLQKQGFKDTRYEQTTEQVTEQPVVPQPTETTEEITENTTEEQTEEEQFESDGSWSLVDSEGNTTMTADIPKDPGETEKEDSTQPKVNPSPVNTDNTTEETSTEEKSEETSDNTTEEVTTAEVVTEAPTTEEITTEKTTEEIKVQPETIKQKNKNEIKEYYVEGDKIYEAPEDIKNEVQIKVNKTLDDLYSGRDTSQDFYSVYSFNTYGATYLGIDNLEVYTQPNDIGFNAYVTYSIKLDGFVYQIHAYLKVEENGTNNYIITNYL